jgi:hypothetical protein
MIGEEGRAQVTRGTGRQRKKQTKPHPSPFFPLASMGSRTFTQKQFLAVMQVGDVVLNPFSLFLFSFDPTGTLLPYSSKKSSRVNLIILPYSSSSETLTYSFLS